jgi:hypothetical protein
MHMLVLLLMYVCNLLQQNKGNVSSVYNRYALCEMVQIKKLHVKIKCWRANILVLRNVAVKLNSVKQSCQSNGHAAKGNQKINKTDKRGRILASMGQIFQKNVNSVNCNSFCERRPNITDKLVRILVII